MAETNRGRRNELVGRVMSDKMNKTITVRVSRLVKHTRYGKFIKKYNTFKAHDEKEMAHIGDTVKIYETRPLSKTKRWKLAEVIEKSVD